MIDSIDYCIVPGLINSHTHLSLAGDGRPYEEMFSDTDEMAESGIWISRVIAVFMGGRRYR